MKYIHIVNQDRRLDDTDPIYDSLAEEGTPLELLFFFSYLLIQGCLSTSDSGSLSSGSLRSS